MPQKKSITATFYKWYSEYDGMGVSMLTRMIGFEEENQQFKKIYLKEKLKGEIAWEALEKSGEVMPS